MPATPIALAERIEGGLMGLLVGDALGVPYEFHTPREIPPAERIEFTPPAGFPAAHRGVPPGTWSDDGAQALCLLASLLEHRTLKLEDFARKIVLWYQEGLFTPDTVRLGNDTDTTACVAAGSQEYETGFPRYRRGG